MRRIAGTAENCLHFHDTTIFFYSVERFSCFMSWLQKNNMLDSNGLSRCHFWVNLGRSRLVCEFSGRLWNWELKWTIWNVKGKQTKKSIFCLLFEVVELLEYTLKTEKWDVDESSKSSRRITKTEDCSEWEAVDVLTSNLDINANPRPRTNEAAKTRKLRISIENEVDFRL